MPYDVHAGGRRPCGAQVRATAWGHIRPVGRVECDLQGDKDGSVHKRHEHGHIPYPHELPGRVEHGAVAPAGRAASVSAQGRRHTHRGGCDQDAKPPRVRQTAQATHCIVRRFAGTVSSTLSAYTSTPTAFTCIIVGESHELLSSASMLAVSHGGVNF